MLKIKEEDRDSLIKIINDITVPVKESRSLIQAISFLTNLEVIELPKKETPIKDGKKK